MNKPSKLESILDTGREEDLAFEAKQKQQILALIEEVIGEDEEWNVKENYGYRQQYQNKLRAEQRLRKDAL